MTRLGRDLISWTVTVSFVAVSSLFGGLAFDYLGGYPSARAVEVVIDASVSTTSSSHSGVVQKTVFVSDQVGYTFYRDGNGSCVFSKTTNGGASWGAAVTVDAQTDCLRVSIWWEDWTPTFTNPRYIHVATIDSGSDDMWYTRLDTTDDSLTSTVNATGANQGGTLAAGANYHSIVMASDGDLYMGVADGSDSYIIRCATASDCTQQVNWSEVTGHGLDLANDPIMMAPLPGGDIIVVRNDISTEDFDYKVWDDGSGTWDASWTDIDTNASDNTTYDASFGLSNDQVTGDVYLAYAADVATLGTDDDVRTAVFSNTTRTWTQKTAVVTDSNDGTSTGLGVTGVSIARDLNTGDVYVVYSARTDPGTATSANVYWRRSTDSMDTWEPRQGPVNTTADDIYSGSPNNINAERLFVTWVEATPDDLKGDTIADLVPGVYQKRYRFRSDDGGEGSGSPLVGENTQLTSLAKNTTVRVRFQVRNQQPATTAYSYRLEWAARNGSTCADADGAETWTAVPDTPTTEHFDMVSTSNFADQDASTNVSTGPGVITDPGESTFTAGKLVESPSNTASSVTLTQRQFTELEYAIQANDNATDGGSYCLRLTNAGTPLVGYDRYAEVQVATASPAVDQVLRHGLWFNGGIKQPFFWAD